MPSVPPEGPGRAATQRHGGNAASLESGSPGFKSPPPRAPGGRVTGLDLPPRPLGDGPAGGSSVRSRQLKWGECEPRGAPGAGTWSRTRAQRADTGRSRDPALGRGPGVGPSEPPPAARVGRLTSVLGVPACKSMIAAGPRHLLGAGPTLGPTGQHRTGPARPRLRGRRGLGRRQTLLTPPNASVLKSDCGKFYKGKGPR